MDIMKFERKFIFLQIIRPKDAFNSMNICTVLMVKDANSCIVQGYKNLKKECQNQDFLM